MSLNSTYHKIVSTVTLIVMLWNIIGWLGAGLLMNHMHSNNEGNHCEVSFCNCEVEEGQSYCTSHHPELHEKENEGMKGNHHENSDVNADYCFYSSPHPVDDNSSEGLVVFAKFNALCHSEDFIFQPFENKPVLNHQNIALLPGFSRDLLRPPRL